MCASMAALLSLDLSVIVDRSRTRDAAVATKPLSDTTKRVPTIRWLDLSPSSTLTTRRPTSMPFAIQAASRTNARDYRRSTWDRTLHPVGVTRARAGGTVFEVDRVEGNRGCDATFQGRRCRSALRRATRRFRAYAGGYREPTTAFENRHLSAISGTPCRVYFKDNPAPAEYHQP